VALIAIANGTAIHIEIIRTDITPLPCARQPTVIREAIGYASRLVRPSSNQVESGPTAMMALTPCALCAIFARWNDSQAKSQ
jgi:hypothetical protein